MLVLSRKKDETIEVNGGFKVGVGGITFVIIEIRGDKVRVGIDAPRSIPVNRGEIQEVINKEMLVNQMQGKELQT